MLSVLDPGKCFFLPGSLFITLVAIDNGVVEYVKLDIDCDTSDER